MKDKQSVLSVCQKDQICGSLGANPEPAQSATYNWRNVLPEQ